MISANATYGGVDLRAASRFTTSHQIAGTNSIITG